MALIMGGCPRCQGTISVDKEAINSPDKYDLFTCLACGYVYTKIPSDIGIGDRPPSHGKLILR